VARCAALAQLAPLTLATKQFLKERSLHHAYTGGLSSYCLVLLLAAYIKHAAALEPQDGTGAPPCLGRLFADTLHFYGRVFDPRRSGVALTDPGDAAASRPPPAAALFPARGGREAAIDVLHISVRALLCHRTSMLRHALLTWLALLRNRTRCTAHK
jgi:hypothetical protein